MIVSLIVAASTNNAIGKNNQLLWKLPNDMKFFKNRTWALPVIMGRKTFESLGKPLNGRVNIIITRQKDFKPEGAVVVSSLEDALFVAKETDCNEIMVIGGGEIYKQALAKANRVYLTRVDVVVEGDTYFPVLNDSWKMISNDPHTVDEKHAYAYDFQIWEKQ